MKISIDIDGVLCEFYQSYYNRFGIPKKDSEITKNVKNILIHDKDFWMNLPVINELNWTPRQYTTARVIRKQWIKDYLQKEMFPKAPIYQIFGYGLSKYRMIKMGGCDFHIDDSLSVFFDLNSKGIPCLLLDNPDNRSWTEPVGRIYSLDKEEIEDTYILFKETVFPYFKEFIK